MKLLARLNPFRVKPASEIIAEELELTQWELETARQVIHNHQFLEHMAQAKIAALQTWNEQRRAL